MYCLLCTPTTYCPIVLYTANRPPPLNALATPQCSSRGRKHSSLSWRTSLACASAGTSPGQMRSWHGEYLERLPITVLGLAKSNIVSSRNMKKIWQSLFGETRSGSLFATNADMRCTRSTNTFRTTNHGKAPSATLCPEIFHSMVALQTRPVSEWVRTPLPSRHGGWSLLPRFWLNEHTSCHHVPTTPI